MIIAVSSQGDNLDSPVDPRFGRAAYFVIYDTDKDSFEAVSNAANVSAAQGAGVQAAQLVASYNPNLVVSGNIGPKAFSVLSAQGVGLVAWSEGSVREAIELAQSKRVETLNKPSVNGHWK